MKTWRCSCCNGLLGMKVGSRIHIRFSRGHQYIVGLPAAARCRKCTHLNEIQPEQASGN